MRKKDVGGRPDKYDKLEIDTRLDEIYMMCVEGLTQEELVKHLKISRTLFYNWMRKGAPLSETDLEKLSNGEELEREYDPKYSAFYKAVTDGSRTSNFSLERTAYKIATGYYEDRVTTKLVDGIPVSFTERVYIEPNEKMTRWLLKNRLPDKYREKTELELGGSIESRTVFSNLSDEKFKILGDLLDDMLDGDGDE